LRDQNYQLILILYSPLFIRRSRKFQMFENQMLAKKNDDCGL
jgi:hypothetical protein